MSFVLVCSGCYNKILQAGWFIYIYKINFFLSYLESVKSKIKVLVDSVSVEGSLPVSSTAVLPLRNPHLVEERSDLSGISFFGRGEFLLYRY